MNNTIEYQKLKQQFPTWPDYVVYDFLYKMSKTFTNQDELNDFLDIQKKDYKNTQWTLQQLPIILDVFHPFTQERILSRKGGKANPLQIPNDAKRHAIQRRLIKQYGISKEPIIVIKTPQGYDLIEGWHRTIQHLEVYTNGYTAPAWVGIGNE